MSKLSVAHEHSSNWIADGLLTVPISNYSVEHDRFFNDCLSPALNAMDGSNAEDQYPYRRSTIMEVST